MDDTMEILLIFGSTADAIAAETTLLKEGTTVRVMSLPSSIRAGCGICLRIPPSQVPAALQAMQDADIPVQELYTRTVQDNQSHYAKYTPET